MASAEIRVSSGESSFTVVRFTLREAVSELFSIQVWARSPSSNVALNAIAGFGAELHIASGLALAALGGARVVRGMCSFIEQVAPDDAGLTTYRVEIVPILYKTTLRSNYRIFQHMTVPAIIDKLLDPWGVARVWEIDPAKYPKLEYRCQYGETDYAFFSRMLGEAGIAFVFEDRLGVTTLVLSDGLNRRLPRLSPPIPFVDDPNPSSEEEHVTEVDLGEEVRNGAYGIFDYDFRNPARTLFGEASPKGKSPEDTYEETTYLPGGFLIETPGIKSDTPAADDKGTARRDPKAGADRATRALEALRTGKRAVRFQTNVVDLAPGVLFMMDHHPRSELSPVKPLLITEFILEGSIDGEWVAHGRAVLAESPFRPPLGPKKPRAASVESATVVGPNGQEIHTDEFGRVRVQFAWDREGNRDERASCWMRVSQGWAGPGYGMFTIPRIGQEVLVAFMNGDPDAPVVVGRVYNATSPPPYKLPGDKTRSTWKTDSSPSSDGFNELLFEDLKNNELVYVQAQKNQRTLVKNDETITVVQHRDKTVDQNEEETTNKDRTQVTLQDRKETTSKNLTSMTVREQRKLVKGEEIEELDQEQVTLVGKDQHLHVRGDRKESIGMEHHVHVKKSRSDSYGGRALGVGGSQHEKMGGSHLLEADGDVHIKSAAQIVLSAPDITLKGGGGFVRVDAGGVTLQGTLVKINAGGAPGSAADAGGPSVSPPRQEKVQTTFTLSARWVDLSVLCGDLARLEGTVSPSPADGPATVEVILVSTGAVLATINTVVTSGRIVAVWLSKAPTAAWRTDLISFRITVPSIGLTGTSTNTFTFARRPTTGMILIDRLLPGPPGFPPLADVHDTTLEADKVRYALRLRTQGAVFTPARQANAKQLIEGPWNNGFLSKRFHRTLCGRGRGCDCQFDCCKAGFRFDVDFVQNGEHVLITMLVPPDPANPPGSGTLRVGSTWYEPPADEPSVYAHETGHLIGQYDEYAGGGNDPTGVQPAVSPIPNLMATRLNTTTLNRHYRWVLEFLNAHSNADPYEIIPPGP